MLDDSYLIKRGIISMVEIESPFCLRIIVSFVHVYM